MKINITNRLTVTHNDGTMSHLKETGDSKLEIEALFMFAMLK